MSQLGAAHFHEDWYSNDQLQALSLLYKLVQRLEGAVIEIGCWEGKSTITLANACYPEQLICNDTWLGNVAEAAVTGSSHPSVEIVAQRDVYAQFMKNMTAATRGNYRVVRRDCNEWLTTFNEPVKFAHIDGSHDYDSVATSLRLLLPHVIPGGILAGDDYLTAHAGSVELRGGVQRAVQEWLPGHTNVGNLWYWQKPL